jgi:putative oxidoreductase
MRKTIEHLYGLLCRYASALQSPFLLVVRLYWGYQFAQAGWGKLQHLDNVVQFFTKLGIPAPAIQAPFVVWLEIVGGILLALGLGSRLLALLLAGDMLVAFVTADHDAFAGFFSDPDTFVKATPCTFLIAALIILIFGPGKFSIDALIGKRLAKT